MKDAMRPKRRTKKAPQPSLKGQNKTKTSTPTQGRLPRTVHEVNETYADAGSRCCI
jgi:hypothetical protein